MITNQRSKKMENSSVPALAWEWVLVLVSRWKYRSTNSSSTYLDGLLCPCQGLPDTKMNTQRKSILETRCKGQSPLFGLSRLSSIKDLVSCQDGASLNLNQGHVVTSWRGSRTGFIFISQQRQQRCWFICIRLYFSVELLNQGPLFVAKWALYSTVLYPTVLAQ